MIDTTAKSRFSIKQLTGAAGGDHGGEPGDRGGAGLHYHGGEPGGAGGGDLRGQLPGCGADRCVFGGVTAWQKD